MKMLKIYLVTELKSRRSLQVKEIAVTGLSVVKVYGEESEICFSSACHWPSNLNGNLQISETVLRRKFCSIYLKQ